MFIFLIVGIVVVKYIVVVVAKIVFSMDFGNCKIFDSIICSKVVVVVGACCFGPIFLA